VTVLFAYGSLIDDRVWKLVAGPGAGPAEAAVLADHTRVFIAGAWYPTVVPSPGDNVAGALRRNVSAAMLQRLVTYESDKYEIRDLGVTLAGGDSETVRCFVTRPAVRLARRKWDYDAWRRKGRDQLVRRLLAGDSVA